MSVSEAFRGVIDESAASTESAPTINGFHLEPRCRICRNDRVRTKVNDLLAGGASYAMVLRALGDDDAEQLEKRDRVTTNSIRNHMLATSRFSRWRAPPTARSWSVGLRTTASSTSSRA